MQSRPLYETPAEMADAISSSIPGYSLAELDTELRFEPSAGGLVERNPYLFHIDFINEEYSKFLLLPAIYDAAVLRKFVLILTECPFIRDWVRSALDDLRDEEWDPNSLVEFEPRVGEPRGFRLPGIGLGLASSAGRFVPGPFPVAGAWWHFVREYLRDGVCATFPGGVRRNIYADLKSLMLPLEYRSDQTLNRDYPIFYFEFLRAWVRSNPGFFRHHITHPDGREEQIDHGRLPVPSTPRGWNAELDYHYRYESIDELILQHVEQHEIPTMLPF